MQLRRLGQDFARAIAEEAVAFDEFDEGWRDEILPGGVGGLDF